MNDLAGTKILIAEDDEGILSLLRTCFESQGAEVFTEEHGRDMVARVDEIQPDIILLDVVMPYVDGFNRSRQSARWWQPDSHYHAHR